MIKVLFFARVREQLGIGKIDIDFGEHVNTLNGLIDYLVAEQGESWKEVLYQNNMVKAVNQVKVDGDSALADSDEVAFYPPVTGG